MNGYRYPYSLLLVLVCACQFDARGVNPGENGDTDARTAVGDADGPDGPCVGSGCSFAYRRPISINVARIGTSLTDVPVAVILDNTRIDYTKVQPDGADLRFYSQDLATSLDYEIERWDPAGRSLVWLLIPELVPSLEPLRLWMYHGDPDAAPGQNPPAVWTNNFVSVHHLAGDYMDSTSANRHGTTPNNPSDTTGPLGGAFAFDGNNDYIALPDETAYDFGTEMSASIWFKVNNFSRDWQALLTKGDHSWRLHRYGGDQMLSFSTTDGGGDHTNHIGVRNVNDGMWHHALITYDGARAILYIDGAVERNDGYTNNLGNTSDPVFIGENNERRDRYFNGSLDEVRIARVPRNQDWAVVEFLAATDDTFVVVGPEEAL